MAIVKHAAPRRRRCEFCNAWAGFQCDAKVSKREPDKTCDAHICANHAHQVGPDLHICPSHFGGFTF